MSCKTPEKLWDMLCELFKRKTVSNKVYTLMQLYGLRMKLVTGSPAAVRRAVGSTCIHWRDSVRAKQGRSSMVLLWDVGRCNVEETGELCARDFLFQRLSVAMQRGNCASMLGTITTWHFFIYLIFVFLFIFLYLCFFFFTSQCVTGLTYW